MLFTSYSFVSLLNTLVNMSLIQKGIYCVDSSYVKHRTTILYLYSYGGIFTQTTILIKIAAVLGLECPKYLAVTNNLTHDRGFCCRNVNTDVDVYRGLDSINHQ